MNEIELRNQRCYTVIKSNEFIQKSRFKLTVTEQKLIWYVISKVKYEDDDFKLYDFTIADFCSVCNIDPESGGNSDTVKKALKTLADKSMYIDPGTGNPKDGILVRWFTKVKVIKGDVSVRLDEDMKPYLIKLTEEYTSLDLTVALSMDRKYSIRLYEVLKSEVWKNSVISFRIDEFMDKLDVAKNKRFSDFQKDILKPALEEINTYADFNTTYTLTKTGRSYSHIHFKFKAKTFLQNNKAIKAMEKQLNFIM